MKKIILSALLILLTISSAFAWYYPDHTNRMEKIIDNTANSNTLIPYQVEVDVDYNANMKTDFSDLKFTWLNTTSAEEQPIDFYIKDKTDSSYANVTLKLPTITGSSNETIYVYYNKPSDTSSSSGTNTYTFFDSALEDAFFNETGIWGEYNDGSNNVTLEDGQIFVNGSDAGGDHYIVSLNNFTVGKKFYFDNLTFSETGNAQMIRFTPEDNGYFIYEWHTSLYPNDNLEIGVGDTLYPFADIPTYPQNVLISWLSNNITAQNETDIFASATTDIPTDERYMRIWTQASDSNITFTRIRVEEYSTPEPTQYAFGIEETYSPPTTTTTIPTTTTTSTTTTSTTLITTTTVTTTTLAPTTTTLVTPTTLGQFGETLHDIGEGTGNFLYTIREPLVNIILGLGLVSIILFMVYAIFTGLGQNISSGNIV